MVLAKCFKVSLTFELITFEWYLSGLQIKKMLWMNDDQASRWSLFSEFPSITYEALSLKSCGETGKKRELFQEYDLKNNSLIVGTMFVLFVEYSNDHAPLHESNYHMFEFYFYSKTYKLVILPFILQMNNHDMNCEISLHLLFWNLVVTAKCLKVIA